MSESNPPEVLKKKRGREKSIKSSKPQPKTKHIQKKLKIRKKPKKNTRQINVIKPKPIKKIITYKNYAPTNINPINTMEKALPEEENDIKKEESCQENSLGQLTKNFINYIKTTGKKSININDLVNELSVKKRRIYDITNVLQGIGYLQKSGKNEIVWTKTISNKTKSKKKLANQKKISSNLNKQKQNIEQLEQEKIEYEKDINKFKDEFNSIAKKVEFAKYGYVTMDDFKSLSINNKVDLLLIKATKGTVMNVLDKNDIKIAYDKVKKLMENGQMNMNELLLNILKKNNQLSFNCPEDAGLSIYNIKNGEIQEIGTNENNNNNEKNDPISKIVNNNFNISKFIENKNINLQVNYNVNFNKDNIIQNNNNNNNNNYSLMNSNKEEVNYNNYPYNKSNFPKNFLINYNERGNTETIPHHITVNNEQKNIGVYATPSKTTYNQSHINNSQIGNNFNYYNYKNTAIKPNIANNNKVNNNFVEERISFSPKTIYQKKY